MNDRISRTNGLRFEIPEIPKLSEVAKGFKREDIAKLALEWDKQMETWRQQLSASLRDAR